MHETESLYVCGSSENESSSSAPIINGIGIPGLFFVQTSTISRLFFGAYEKIMINGAKNRGKDEPACRYKENM